MLASTNFTMRICQPQLCFNSFILRRNASKWSGRFASPSQTPDRKTIANRDIPINKEEARMQIIHKKHPRYEPVFNQDTDEIISDPLSAGSFIEKQIKKAVDAGEFDNLSGHGKPLPSLSEPQNPWVDPADEIAFKLLKRNNAAPEWVEMNKKIFTTLKEARDDLKHTHILYQKTSPSSRSSSSSVSSKENNPSAEKSTAKSFFANLFSSPSSWSYTPSSNLSPEEKELLYYEKVNHKDWELKVNMFKEKIREINRWIETYNAMVPISRQMMNFDPEYEVEKVVNPSQE